MSDPNKLVKYQKGSSKPAEKTAETEPQKQVSTSSKQQKVGPGPPKTNNASGPAPSTLDGADVFEDIDLSDPPVETPQQQEPGYDFVEHGEANHSSYNSQPDHPRKYPEGFGKKGGGEDK